MPLEDCVLMAMGKLIKFLKLTMRIDVVTQPCVTNLAITHAVQAEDFTMLQIPQVKLLVL